MPDDGDRTDAGCARGRDGEPHHRRRADQCAQGHLGDSCRRADRRADPAVLRPSAARSGRRLQAVPGRGRGPAQADGVLHHHVHPRHGGPHPVHLGGRRQGPARRDGTAADQPSAGLPGLRQGRRVPAAEPGHVQRPRRDPLRRRQTHVPQTDPDLVRGAAGPGTLRAVRAMHPVLPADRGRPVHRTAGARCAAAGRHRAG